MNQENATKSRQLSTPLTSPPSSQSLIRQLLVAAITTLACAQMVAWSIHGLGTLFGYSGRGPGPYRLFVFLPTCLAFWMADACFSRWAARRNRGERIWFSSWSTTALALCCGLLLASCAILPGPWDLLRSVFDIPQSFQFYWVFGFLASRVAPWSWIVFVALLVANYLILVLFRIALCRARSGQIEDPSSKSVYPSLALLWALPVLLYGIEVTTLRLWSGMGDQPRELSELFWALPVQGATTVVAMLACCSWIRWCGVVQSGRATCKVAMFWGLFLLAHMALLSINVYLDSTAMADEKPYYRAFVQWPLPGSDTSLYLVQAQNLEQGLYWMLGGPIFIAFLVLIVVVTVETTHENPDSRSVKPGTVPWSMLLMKSK